MPSVGDLTDLTDSFLGVVAQLVGLESQIQIEKAIRTLYDEADQLAVMTVKSIAALLWWAAHIGAATGTADMYGAQIQAALTAAGNHSAATWREFLTVKYPADLHALYDTLHGESKLAHRQLSNNQAKGLGQLAAEIAALMHWRKHTVTPELVAWTRFSRAWKRDYLPIVRTVGLWLKTPSTFGAWAAMPILTAAAGKLAQQDNATLATAVEQALAQTWANDPNGTLNSALAWLVAE